MPVSTRSSGFVLLLAAVGTVGCSENNLKSTKDTTGTFVEGAAPQIAVDPPAIDFGDLTVGSSSDPATVTVTNVGTGLLTLGDVHLADATAPYTITTPGSNLLDPGASTSFLVTFTPSAAGTIAGEVDVESNDPAVPVVPVALSGAGDAPDVVIDPASYDFGTLDYAATASLTLTISNDGNADLAVSDITYTSVDGVPQELTMRPSTAPLTLAPGASTTVTVDYAPTDAVADEGYVTVYSNDPDTPEAVGTQIGNGRVFEGFSTGWYIVDDTTNYETTSNPSYSITYYGDPGGYWYEPSGAHGLIGSTDPTTDFATMHDYVLARAAAPTPVSTPLTFNSTSTVPAFTYASYSYILCDFWIDASDDPSLYEVRAGSVDDGAQVMVNGQIMTNWYLGAAGSVNIGPAIMPGAVNSLIVILMDNSASQKYLTDLGFYRDGVFVSG